jgi:predicted small integral membrane protein
MRTSKTLLLFAVTIYYSFVVLNNTTDYDSNFQVVRHVLMMDSTFPHNRGMWRAIHTPAIHTLFYFGIMLWEIVTMLLSGWGAVRMARARKGSIAEFHRAKRVGILALTASLLMWLLAFLSVGGEWFLMWQSKSWNGQDAAFRMFTVIGIIFLIIIQPDTAEEP